MSEGRGTTRPFELVGAPYIEPEEYGRRLNALGLPRRLLPAHRVPADLPEARGQELRRRADPRRDRDAFEPVKAGLAVVKVAYDMYTREFKWKQPPYEYVFDKNPFDVISGTSALREGIESGRSLDEMEKSWQGGTDAFRRQREKYLLY
jgi:uncharacterized protein YbbC (DUF1343 family)